MSYAYAAALQTAVFARLSGDAALTALVGTAVYDAVPPGPLPALYVVLGPETAKEAAAAVSSALVDAPLSLSAGRLVALNFLKANAKREGAGAIRRVDMTFAARVAAD